MKRLFPKVLGGAVVLAIAVSVWSGTSKAAPETFNTALEKDDIARAGFRVNF